MSTIQNQEPDDAKDQAKAQYESICRMLGALDVDYDRLEELKDEFKLNTNNNDRMEWAKENSVEFCKLQQAAGDCTSRDDAQERLYEFPLSVQVRSGWVSPGEDMEAAEFEILLCTGGPAVRIRGELDEHNQPDRAWIEYSGWGTGWCQYFDAEQATLLAYANQFSYGE